MKLSLVSLLLPFLSVTLAEVVVLPNCDDLADSISRFYINGTYGSEMKFCDWAGRNYTNPVDRCDTAVVRETCPVTCKVECIASSDGDGDGDGDGPNDEILGASANQRGNTDTVSPETIIVASTLSAFAALALVGMYVTRRGDKTEVTSGAFSIGSQGDEESDMSLNDNNEDLEIPEPVLALPEKVIPRMDSVTTQELQKCPTICSVCP